MQWTWWKEITWRWGYQIWCSQKRYGRDAWWPSKRKLRFHLSWVLLPVKHWSWCMAIYVGWFCHQHHLGRSEKRIKKFRNDRGVEFFSSQFTTFCEDSGAVRDYTAPYSPRQNGVVERRNRTIVVMEWSFLKAKEVPPEFWGAVRHSVYVLNKLPTRALSSYTPYEAGLDQNPISAAWWFFGVVYLWRYQVYSHEKIGWS